MARNRGEGSVRRRPDGRWESRLRLRDPITGLPRRISLYGDTQREVLEKLRDAQHGLVRGEALRDESVRLDQVLEYWIDQQREIKPSTERSYRNAVRIIAKSKLGPMKLDKLNAAASCKPVKATKREMTTLNIEQARVFLDAAKSDRYYVLYYLAIYTGMRTLNQDTKTTGTPKTRTSRRVLSIGPGAIAALRTLPKLSDIVFASEVGTYTHASNLLRRSFHPLLIAAGLPRVRFHDLRHTAATIMLESGVRPKIVSDRLGHSTVTITMDLYQHVLPSMDRALSDFTEEALEK